jgi:biopolymer transport protein ExbD
MRAKRERRRIHKKGHGTMNELNITPLLDLVFVLLVIFIITTPQLTNNLEINLPSGKPPPKKNQEKPKINKLYVDEKGQVLLNQQVYTLPELRATLAAMKAEDKDVSVVVDGADDAEYQNMINVLDIISQLEITKIGITTPAG